MRKLLLLLLLANRLTAATQSDEIRITSFVPATNGTLRISWSGGIPPYKLQCARRIDGNWTDVTWHIYANSYVVLNVQSPAYFRVRSIPDRLPPPALTGFGPRGNSCNSVWFTWDELGFDPPGGTGTRGTRIYRDGAFLVEIPFPITAFSDNTVSDATNYRYWATTVDKAGNESPRSGIRAVETAHCSPSVTLAWDANPEQDIAGYRLHYGFAPGNYFQVLDVGNVVLTTVPDLITGAPYYFAVSGYNTSGLGGDVSNEVVYIAP